jgi:hypothetical protein
MPTCYLRSMEYAPTLSSAKAFCEAGALADWCQSFLRDESFGGESIDFADGLLREPDAVYWLCEVELSDLYPCCGPDPDFDYPTSAEYYETKVGKMKELIEGGWDAPPLSVHMPSLYLCDGTHRHGALLRLGYRRYWSVLWMSRPPLVGRGQQWGPRDSPRIAVSRQT